MKTILIIILFAGALTCKAQSTPEYQYAVFTMEGRDWTIHYEDSTQQLNTGVFTYNKEYYTRMLNTFHYLNQQGYELISCGKDRASTNGSEYYFKRPKRK